MQMSALLTFYIKVLDLYLRVFNFLKLVCVVFSKLSFVVISFLSFYPNLIPSPINSSYILVIHDLMIST